MNSILIFGHKNPDTDSICSAISLAKLNSLRGFDSTPCRLGNISKETEFVLNKFGVDLPKLLTCIDPTTSSEKQKVALVDHNEFNQSVEGISNAQIIQVVDHHKFGNFETSEPVKINADAVGCTCTIIFDLYKEAGIVPEKNIAGLMMSAILSDTLIFKSPTCTEKDILAVEELAVIAEVEDFKSYGMEMLIAGTSLSDKTPEEILAMDQKEFQMNEMKLAIAQVNTVDIEGTLKQKSELEKAMADTNSKNGYSLSILVITDIVKEGSQFIVVGDSKIVEKAFNVTLNNNTVWIDGIMSRKKQVVPFLMDAAQGMA